MFQSLLGGSWDLVNKVINKVTILITPVKALITLLTKSHDPLSSMTPHRGIGVQGRYKQPATKYQPPATVGVAGGGIEPHRTANSNT